MGSGSAATCRTPSTIPSMRWGLRASRSSSDAFMPLSRAAATMASQSARVVAMGFSQSTCLPALRAAMVSSAWAVLAAQMLTASMAGSASSASYPAKLFAKPYRPARAWARALSRAAMA